jgi:hypothetical protein
VNKSIGSQLQPQLSGNETQTYDDYYRQQDPEYLQSDQPYEVNHKNLSYPLSPVTPSWMRYNMPEASKDRSLFNLLG